MNVVALLTALGTLFADFLSLVNLKDWNGLGPLLEKIKADWDAIMAQFGGETAALELLATATPNDFAAAQHELTGGKLQALPGWTPDGTWLKFLLTYGPQVYNWMAAIFGWPVLPPIPVPAS